MSDSPNGDQLFIMNNLTVEEQDLEANKCTKLLNIQLLKATDLSETNDFSGRLEIKVRKVKRALEKWKEIVLKLNSVILWEKQWHAGLLFGVTTLVFMIIWMFEPSVLTTIADLGLLIVIGDFCIPKLASSIYGNEEWTGKNEKSYDYICRNIVIKYARLLTIWTSFRLLRSTKPLAYYGTTIAVLGSLAWIGNSINNLFLTYIVILFMIMLPGLENNSVVSNHTQRFYTKIKDLVVNVKSKPE